MIDLKRTSEMMQTSRRNYYSCLFCDVHFYSIKSFNKHKADYCHKRKKLPLSSTVTSDSDLDSTKQEFSESSKEKPSTSIGLAHLKKEHDVEQFQRIEHSHSEYTQAWLHHQFNNARNSPNKKRFNSAFPPASRGRDSMSSVPEVPFAKNWNTDAPLGGSFNLAVEIDHSKYLHESQLGDATKSDYTERWLHQQFQNWRKSPKRKRFNSALLRTLPDNDLTSCVPGLPFIQKKNADVPLADSFNPSVEMGDSKHLHEDQFLDVPALDIIKFLNAQFNSYGKLLMMTGFNSALLRNVNGNDDGNADESLDGSISPTIETDHSKYLQEDQFREVTTLEDSMKLLSQQFNNLSESPKRTKCRSALLPDARGNDTTSLVPGVPVAEKRNADVPLGRSFHPAVEAHHSKDVHEYQFGDVTNIDNTQKCLSQKCNYSVISPKRIRFRNSLLPAATGNDDTSLVPRMPFAENWNAGAPLEGSQTTVISPKRIRFRNSLLTAGTGNDDTSLVPRVPFAGNWNADVPLGGSFHPAVEAHHSKDVHEDEFGDSTNIDNTQKCLSQKCDYSVISPKRIRFRNSLLPAATGNDTSLVPRMPFAENWNPGAPLEGSQRTVISPKRIRFRNSLLPAGTGNDDTSLVPRVPFPGNWIADVPLGGSFHPAVEAHHSKDVHEDEFGDATNIDNTQKCLSQKRNYSVISPKRIRFRNSLFPAATGNDDTSLVPRMPFAENWNVGAPLEGSLYATKERERVNKLISFCKRNEYMKIKRQT